MTTIEVKNQVTFETEAFFSISLYYIVLKRSVFSDGDGCWWMTVEVENRLKDMKSLTFGTIEVLLNC